MSTTTRKKTTISKPEVSEELDISISEDTIEVVDEKKEIKYNPDDLIPCRSLINGNLYVKGERSGFVYNWADYGDVIDVEYRDLNHMIHTSDNVAIYSPRIIIEDENIVAQNPKIKALYDSLYSINDLKEILTLPAKNMKKQIEALPVGVKNSLRGIVSDMIENGSLDSVSRIKAIDEIFGTQMLLTLAEN